MALPGRCRSCILSGIPRISAANADSARRFTWLVDIFYDERIKLICSAATVPEELYIAGPAGETASVEFARTVSRLTEMQSTDYLQAEKPKH